MLSNKNTFEALSLPPRLSLSEQELRDAFREVGKTAHPDAGGDSSDFEKLQAAFETLSSPSQRLIHWLALQGIPIDTRGTIDTHLMDLFGTVSEISNRAGELARKRASSRSALGLALLENDTQSCLEVVATTITLVDQAIALETSHFPDIEAGRISDTDTFSRCARNLLFLEKWRKTLRSISPTLM